MKNTNNTGNNFAGNAQQVINDAIIEAVQASAAAYGKYGSRRIPDDDLEDVTQEAFWRAFRSIGSYDSSKASIQTWISKIVYNCVCDYWNDRAKREGWSNYKSNQNVYDSYSVELEDCFTGAEYNYKDTTPCDICSDSDPEEDLISKEQRDWLYSRIDCFPDKSRFIIEQTLDGVKPAQIAAELGCTPNSVSIILHRTIQAMKNETEDGAYLAA